METLASFGMLSCSLGCSCLASLDLAFLEVRDIQVKGSHVLPGCRLVSHAKMRYTLRHILVFIFDSFFNPHFRIFSGVREEASAGFNAFGEVCNFRKKSLKFRLPPTSPTENFTHAPYSCSCMYALALLSLFVD